MLKDTERNRRHLISDNPEQNELTRIKNHIIFEKTRLLVKVVESVDGLTLSTNYNRS